MSRADRRARRARGRDGDLVVYLDRLCGYYTVTRQIDPTGVVPDELGCRNPAGCPNTAGRLRELPRPWPANTPIDTRWEWYQPDAGRMDLEQRRGGPLWEHIRRGGLMLRLRGPRR